MAELTYSNYVDPFELEDLWKPRGGYFAAAVDQAHFAPNKYKRFVISNLLKDAYSGANWVVDLAAGRGADLPRYQQIGVKNGLFIDIDPSAIAELIRRRFETPRAKKIIGSGQTAPVYDRVHDVVYDNI